MDRAAQIKDIRHCRPRRQEGGFTLIEVLIAVALLAVLLAALYASFFSAHRAATSGNETLLRLHELRTSLDIIRRELEAMLPESRKDNKMSLKDRDIFGQKASLLSFSTHVSHIPGAAAVEYYVEERDNKLYLMKSVRPAFAPEEEARTGEVVEDLVSFDVQVFSGQLWQSTWNERRPPPKLRITITAKVEGRTLELSETVLPRINRKI